ncbi:unnamed protein product [Chondrus crispus]|uniref:Uncharacterized protein n=1 Tax=Chondrus crispus TaxID=2769 RepID=R7QJ17_CHOCR|nr:unnamed protein product [Chondrus crispus]CDF38074.1 unnamed protein product [Chondrus crispus]|eukprot:XP_005717943.1 unnamed protein product [Chondrus crispus]
MRQTRLAARAKTLQKPPPTPGTRELELIPRETLDRRQKRRMRLRLRLRQIMIHRAISSVIKRRYKLHLKWKPLFNLIPLMDSQRPPWIPAQKKSVR